MRLQAPAVRALLAFWPPGVHAAVHGRHQCRCLLLAMCPCPYQGGACLEQSLPPLPVLPAGAGHWAPAAARALPLLPPACLRRASGDGAQGANWGPAVVLVCNPCPSPALPTPCSPFPSMLSPLRLPCPADSQHRRHHADANPADARLGHVSGRAGGGMPASACSASTHSVGLQRAVAAATCIRMRYCIALLQDHPQGAGRQPGLRGRAPGARVCRGAGA